MADRHHDEPGEAPDIQPGANAAVVYFHYRNQGFELEAVEGHTVEVSPADQLTDHDWDVLLAAQRDDGLWAMVTAFSIMDGWRHQPLTLEQLAAFTLRDCCHYNFRHTPPHHLRSLKAASREMARSSETDGDEDATHLWEMRERILNAELERRAKAPDGLDVGR